MKAKNVVQSEQFGFLANHSTSHAIQIIKNDVTNGIKKKQSTSMVLLDIQKAFDCVWHTGLIYKMIKLGFSPNLIKVIHSYLKSREFIVNVENSSSRPRKIKAGVPQGSILGPILFLIYIHDIPKHPRTRFTIFADDTTIRSTETNPDNAVRNVQEHLRLIEPYYFNWKIRVNALKSEHIIFTNKRNTQDITTLSFNNNNIQRKNIVKYLGVTLQSNMKFTTHCSNVVQQARGTISRLWSVIGPKSKLNSLNKITIYKLYTRSILTYDIQVWNDVSSSTLRKIQRLQNNALRLAMGLRPHPVTHKQVTNGKVHEMARIETIKEFSDRLYVNFVNQCMNHDNYLIRELFTISTS